MSLQEEIKSCVAKVLKNEEIQDLHFHEDGDKSKKGDGFIGDIIFLDAKGKNKAGEKIELNLVVKCSKTGKNYKEHFSGDTFFAVEIYTYSKVFPVFNALQSGLIEDNKLRTFPKYFGTIEKNERIIMVFENLKKRGYEMWPRQKPITVEHTRKVIPEYAKWHALSFVLRDQRPELFEKLASNRPNCLQLFIDQSNFHKATARHVEFIKNGFMEGKLTEKMLKNLQKIENNIKYIYTELYKEDREFASISHGDCWNNNIMYKYKMCPKTGKKIVDGVKIIDWQCSTLAPPMVDLGHFLYATSGKPQFEIHEELLELYYTSFSNFAKQLGSDPNKIYPYSKFLEQWKRFSKFGFLLSCSIYKFMCAEEKDLPNFEDLAHDDPERDRLFDFRVDMDLYQSRIEALWEHYLNLDIL